MEFCPGNPCSFLFSGDKTGTVVAWDIGIPDQAGKASTGIARYPKVHSANINAMHFDGTRTVLSVASDGLVRQTHIGLAESPASSETLLNMNPQGWTGDCKLWRMGTSMTSTKRQEGAQGALYVGDDAGDLYIVDGRIPQMSGQESFNAHKSKIQHLDSHPLYTHLLCSSSNDKTIRMWDVRRLARNTYLSEYNTGRAVASAYFSPHTGSKLLVTCNQNKTYVWTNTHTFGYGPVAPPPDLDIVHSHMFNRYVTNSRSIWDPKDAREDLFLCGRYLGEAYDVPGSDQPVLLHPIDLFSVSAKATIGSIVDTSVRTICSVNRFHPSEDLIASGSSSHLYLWGHSTKWSSVDRDQATEANSGDEAQPKKTRRRRAQSLSVTTQRANRRRRPTET